MGQKRKSEISYEIMQYSEIEPKMLDGSEPIFDLLKS